MTLKLYRIGCHLTGPSSVDALGKAVVPWQKRTSGSIMSLLSLISLGSRLPNSKDIYRDRSIESESRLVVV